MEGYKLPMEMLESGEVVKICAPMVRYSRLAFRTLVRRYNCDLAFTPMIIADSFLQSAKARDSDFTSNKGAVCYFYDADDRPLIVQFAAKEVSQFSNVAEMISGCSDGIDINCGCPQRWAMQEGYGSCLMNKPELVSDMVHQARNQISNPHFSVSIKIRIHEDLRRTVEFCERAVRAGVSWITVHGRTPAQRCQPVNIEAIKLIRESVSVPVIANGDVRTLADVQAVHNATGVHGVMSARGILSNPAMFAGYDYTPVQCIEDWVKISSELGVTFQAFHNHLMFMMENITSKAEKKIFNSLTSTSAVIDYLSDNYDITLSNSCS